MAAESPLAEVLTGLELLLARSQLWQESAASHVSLARQLERLAALALRWRRMQLHAWRHTINKLKARHAAGATSYLCSLQYLRCYLLYFQCFIAHGLGGPVVDSCSCHRSL